MSDAWINSLVQSPLVRTLNSVPSKSTHFVYGIPDNVPPFSLDKITVQPNSGADGKDDRLTFRIPQNGYLNRMVLKLTVFRSVTQPSTYRLINTYSDAWNAARFVSNVQLKSHNRTLLTLYGDTLVAKASRLPAEESDAVGRCMRGFCRGAATSNAAEKSLLPWLPDASVAVYDVCHAGFTGTAEQLSDHMTTTFNVISRGMVPYQQIDTGAGGAILTGGNFATGNLASQSGVMYIPLPFNCFENPAKNFQTRFIEDLELEVNKTPYSTLTKVYSNNTAAVDAQALSVKGELLCYYHTFHDSVENAIRNKNYKRGVPASILMTDEVQETYSTLPATDTVGSPASQASSVPTVVTWDLRSNHLITSLTLIHTRKVLAKSAANAVASFDIPSTNMGFPTDAVNGIFPLEMAVKGSGRTIWRTNRMENFIDNIAYRLSGQDLGRLVSYSSHGTNVLSCGVRPVDYDTEAQTPGSSLYGRTDVVANTGANSVYGAGYTAYPFHHLQHYINGKINDLYGSCSTTIRFAFDDNDSMNTGGLALQSIADPKLEVLFNAPVGYNNDYLKLYVQYKCIVRIDSDTGVISRTMDQ